MQCGLTRLLGSPPLHGGVIKYPGGLLNPGGVHNSFYCDKGGGRGWRTSARSLGNRDRAVGHSPAREIETKGGVQLTAALNLYKADIVRSNSVIRDCLYRESVAHLVIN